VCNAFLELFGIADQVVLLLVDDLQWLDPCAVVFGFVARRAAGAVWPHRRDPIGR
jgi:hypothetical protein